VVDAHVIRLVPIFGVVVVEFYFGVVGSGIHFAADGEGDAHFGVFLAAVDEGDGDFLFDEGELVTFKLGGVGFAGDFFFVGGAAEIDGDSEGEERFRADGGVGEDILAEGERAFHGEGGAGGPGDFGVV